MLEPAVVFFRLIQYAGAAILLGTSLVFAYGLPRTGVASAATLAWPKRLLASAAVLALAGSLLGLIAQTAVMAGSLQEGLKLSSLSFVIGQTSLGRAGLVRTAASALALAAILGLKPGRSLWLWAAAWGAVVCASFPWMGHGAATQGPGAVVHLASDLLHALAAAIWIGALVAFLGLLSTRSVGADDLDRACYRALHGFAGIGSCLVAALVATGLVNSWFLVGPTRLDGLWTTAYGRLLVIKLLLFATMLAFAAVNRWRLTPALRTALEASGPTNSATRKLKISLLLETSAALGVLALVAWLGALGPISSR